MGSHRPNHHFGVYRRVKGRIKDYFHTAADDDESCTTLSAATSAPTPTRDQAIQGEENSPTPNNPGLWEEAFSQLEYNDQVALISNPTNATDNDEPTSSGLEDVLDKVIETVKTQSEIRKLKCDTRISEGARTILNAALALQSNISALVASDPTGHASSVWAVISLGLTVSKDTIASMMYHSLMDCKDYTELPRAAGSMAPIFRIPIGYHFPRQLDRSTVLSGCRQRDKRSNEGRPGSDILEYFTVFG